MTSFNVRSIMNELRRKHENDPAQLGDHGVDLEHNGGLFVEEELANQISSNSHFDAEKESMYYFVREPQFE